MRRIDRINRITYFTLMARLDISVNDWIFGPDRALLEVRRGPDIHAFERGVSLPLRPNRARLQIGHGQPDAKGVGRHGDLALRVDTGKGPNEHEWGLRDTGSRKWLHLELRIAGPDQLHNACRDEGGDVR